MYLVLHNPELLYKKFLVLLLKAPGYFISDLRSLTPNMHAQGDGKEV